MQPQVFWLGLFAATGYALAAVLLKVAMERGCSPATINFYCNLLMALLLQSVWSFEVEPGWLNGSWKPAFCGLTFYIGQLFTFASLARSEVSVTTPILGAKVIFVVLFLSLFGGTIPGGKWWVSAALCFTGIFLVSARRGFFQEAGRHLGGTLAALGAAASFGVTDALFQLWVPNLGFGAFAALMFLFMAFFSTTDSLLRHKKVPPLPPEGTRVWAWSGLLLLCLQSALVAAGIGMFRDAAGTNIVYGSRAVLGVAFALVAARFLESDASQAPVSDVARKLTGGILVFAAIAIVLL